MKDLLYMALLLILFGISLFLKLKIFNIEKEIISLSTKLERNIKVCEDGLARLRYELELQGMDFSKELNKYIFDLPPTQ